MMYINVVNVYINISKAQFLFNIFPTPVIVLWTRGWCVSTFRDSSAVPCSWDIDTTRGVG